MNKTKNLFVIPHEQADYRGIKPLIESLAGGKLEWHNRINNHFAWRTTLCTIGEYQVNVVVSDVIEKKMGYVWSEVAEKINEADLVLYVFDSMPGTNLNDTDEFFDRYFKSGMKSDRMMSKRFLVFTKSEKTDAWWNSLTEEERVWQTDSLMCSAMCRDLNCNDNGDVFDCSCSTGAGIGELRNRMIEFFGK